jgi:hypothetical protein
MLQLELGLDAKKKKRIRKKSKNNSPNNLLIFRNIIYIYIYTKSI